MRRVFLFLFHHIISIRIVEFFPPTIGFVDGKKNSFLRSRNLFLAPRRTVMGSGCSYCFGGFFFCWKFTKVDNNSCSTENTAAVAPTNNTNKTTRLSDPLSNRMAESVHCLISFLFFFLSVTSVSVITYSFSAVGVFPFYHTP